MAEVAAVVKPVYEVRRIADVFASPLNPRKTFNSLKLEELAASITSKGIIEPLVVRPRMELAGGGLEIVAGERRWRAAKKAGLAEVPCIVRQLSDVEVLELMAIENSQRDDLHPLEEMAGYLSLMRVAKGYTPATIAEKVGKSVRSVQNVLHYQKLIAPAKEAFLAGEITAGHADLIVRLSADEQAQALDACFHEVRDDGIYELGEKATESEELVSVRELNDWIDGHIRLALRPGDPQLELLPELAEAIAAEQAADAPKLIELIDAHWTDPKLKNQPLNRKAWTYVKKGQKCDSQVRGVIVVGRGRGRIFTVCTGVGKCKVHWGHTITAAPAGKAKAGNKPTPTKTAAEVKWQRQRAERVQQEKLWGTVRLQALKLIAPVVSKLKPGPVAFGLIGDALRELGTFDVPSKPTLEQLVMAVVRESADADQATFEHEIAKPLGVNLKPLFAAAAPKPSEKPDPKKPAKKKPAQKPARAFLAKDVRAGVKKALAKKKGKK